MERAHILTNNGHRNWLAENAMILAQSRESFANDQSAFAIQHRAWCESRIKQAANTLIHYAAADAEAAASKRRA